MNVYARFAAAIAIAATLGTGLGVGVNNVMGRIDNVPAGAIKYSYDDAFLYLDNLTFIGTNTNSDRGEDKTIMAQAAAVANIIYDHGNGKARKALKERGWLPFGDDGSCCTYKPR